MSAQNSTDAGDRGAAEAKAANPTKASLRAQLRGRRRALTAAGQAQAAAGLASQLQHLPAFAHARRIAFYLARDGEIDPGAALQHALDRGAQCYAPVIVGDSKILRFAALTAGAEFRAGRFGLKEPLVDADGYIAARDLDLVLVPLVGFDHRGNRLGMGGGFYDATFAPLKNADNRGPTGPVLVGLAHEIQRVAAITADAWDIPLTAVVTDRRVYHCAADIENTVTTTGDIETTGIDTVNIEDTVTDKLQRAEHSEAIPCATG